MNLDPGYLIASMLVSSVGFVLWTYGKKQRRFPHSAMGIVLLIYPYFISNVALMIGIGVMLMVLLAAAVFILGM